MKVVESLGEEQLVHVRSGTWTSWRRAVRAAALYGQEVTLALPLERRRLFDRESEMALPVPGAQ